MKWQPIETAPKDGTAILVCYKASENHWPEMAVAEWTCLEELWVDGYQPKDSTSEEVIFNYGWFVFNAYGPVLLQNDWSVVWTELPDLPEDVK